MSDARIVSKGIRFADFAAWTGAVLEGPAPETFTGVTFDSRKVTPGCLYMAFPGATCDGHEFVAQALAKGAAAALVRSDWAGAEPGQSLVRVDDPKAALPVAAKAYRNTLAATVIGVTGSAGKTTTKEFTAAFLRAGGFRVHATEGNYNNHLGVPITLLCAPSDVDFLVVEMGTNHPGEIQYLVDIAQPDAGLISSIGTAHIEFFKTQDGIADEKGTLFENLGRCPAPGDRRSFAVLARENCRYDRLVSKCRVPVVTVGGQDAEVAAFKSALCVRLPGDHNVSNALIAFGCARQFGVSLEQCLAALQNFTLPGGRWRVVERDGVTWIDDTYNANPTSMIVALETFAGLPLAPGGRRVAVLGDMFELGEQSDELHRQVGQRAGELGFDDLLFVGESAVRVMAAAASGKACAIHCAANLDEAREQLQRLIGNDGKSASGVQVLVKASHGMKLRELLPV